MDWKIIRKIARDAFRIDHVKCDPCHVVTTTNDNHRSYLLPDGRFYAPLIDTLEDQLRQKDVSVLSVARITSTIKGDAAYGNVVSPEGAFARALLTKRLHRVMSVRWRYPFSKMEERIWGTMLDTTGAKKVVGLMPSRELCVAARKRGVWVADMQHGVIADSHPWYGERFRSHEAPEFLPHGFLVWDPGSAEVLEWTKRSGVEVRVIGNVWVSRFLARAKHDRLVSGLQTEADRTYARKGKKNVLVSLSWNEYNIPNGLISEELVSVIRQTQDDFNWVLRLHPNQVRGFKTDDSARFMKYYERALAGHAEWREATYAPLPLILSHMDLHVTWTSSVCIEAAHFGIRSCLLDPRMSSTGEVSDYYRYYKRQGAIIPVENTPTAILDWLMANKDNVKQPEDYGAYDREFASIVSFLAS